MSTHNKSGYQQPRAALHLEVLSPVPRSYRDALADPNWRKAMKEECAALHANQAWDLVQRLVQANIVTGKWIFRHKFHSDGSFDRYKVRW
jgi:hypothetical protein